jgi:hypothetical protein
MVSRRDTIEGGDLNKSVIYPYESRHQKNKTSRDSNELTLEKKGSLAKDAL